MVSIEGIVKWFDPRKGFGFIVGPQGQDIFAHYTAIKGEGFRALKDGSTVTYDATYDPAKGEKGWRATRIECIPSIEPGRGGSTHYTGAPRMPEGPA